MLDFLHRSDFALTDMREYAMTEGTRWGSDAVWHPKTCAELSKSEVNLT